MRLSLCAAAWFLCISVAQGQQPPAATPAPDDPPAQPQGGLHPKPPLTPAEQREREIRMFDPLDKSNPVPGAPEAEPVIPAPPPGDSQQRIFPSPQNPLPGSATAPNSLTPVNPRGQGPQVTIDDPGGAPVQDYAGPAVLSRSYTLARPVVPRELRWTPVIGMSGIYDTGLTGGRVNPDGTLQNVGAFGYSANWGLSGRHFWKHDQAGLQYSGNYNQYATDNKYSGFNHSLNADFAHEFTRRLILNFTESGSITSQSNALLDPTFMPGLSQANIDLAASPLTQILDQGTRQFSSMADLTWQQSSRLSFNFGGGFFLVNRIGAGTFGNTGYQAKADVSYRYTRRMTIGAYYSFTDYAFVHQIEVSDAHTVGGIFSYALSRRTQLRLRAGITRSENKGLTSVTIDPAIAALIGRSTAIVNDYTLSRFSDISAELVKDFGRARSANISYAHGLAPGNGILLTSVQQAISASYSMTWFRYYRVNFMANHTSLSSVSQTIANYSTDSAGIGLTRALSHGVGTHFDFGFRRFNLSNQPTVTTQFRVSAGITWSPGEGVLW